VIGYRGFFKLVFNAMDITLMGSCLIALITAKWFGADNVLNNVDILNVRENSLINEWLVVLDDFILANRQSLS